MSGTHIAYCYRTGEIEIMSAGSTRPAGVIVFARGPRDQLEHIISARARHGRQCEVYLVPGVPEADDDDAALAALMTWMAWAFADCLELLSKVRLPGGEG